MFSERGTLLELKKLESFLQLELVDTGLVYHILWFILGANNNNNNNNMQNLFVPVY